MVYTKKPHATDIKDDIHQDTAPIPADMLQDVST
jgi:hypothetical protein